MIMYLVFQSYEDIKRRSITVISVLIFSLLAIIFNLFTDYIGVKDMIFGICIGIGVTVIGILMNNAIGIGDGFLLSSLGILLGGRKCFLIFMIAISLSAITAMILLILKKVTVKQELPFVPYILGAYMIMIF